MRFMWNAFIYALLMVGLLAGAFTIDGYFMLDLGEIQWTLVGSVLTALTFGFKSAIEANIDLIKQEKANAGAASNDTGNTAE